MKRNALLLLPALLAACGAPSLVRHRPESPTTNREVTAMWAKDIRQNARSGDWILTRSYSAVGDLIAAATWGEELSHASIYDAERGTVIEAVSSGVREVPLEALLDRNRVAFVVRPYHQTAAQGRIAVARARWRLGTEFDKWGLIGLSADDKYYCSELVAWASEIDAGALVTPAELMEHGEVIYASGIREDADVQRIARRRMSTIRTASR